MDVTSLLDGKTEIGRLPDALLAAGAYAFTTQDAAHAAGISTASARPALARLIRNRLAFSPARGLYIAIPPEYRSWEAVPAPWFIDALMGHLDRAYHVGLLSAAEQHGAGHQRPQAFQVVVDCDLRDRSFGRVRLRFVTNRGVGALPTQRVNVPTGVMVVATPEVTVLELAERPGEGGGLDNVATVIGELAREGRLGVHGLVALTGQFPVAASRRVGWLAERFGAVTLDRLAAAIGRASAEASNLDPFGPRRGPVDSRWHIRVNAAVEPDL